MKTLDLCLRSGLFSNSKIDSSIFFVLSRAGKDLVNIKCVDNIYLRKAITKVNRMLIVITFVIARTGPICNQTDKSSMS
jgi:hypothetical protein